MKGIFTGLFITVVGVVVTIQAIKKEREEPAFFYFAKSSQEWHDIQNKKNVKPTNT